MKIGKKKASLISAVALALMVSMAAGLFMQRSGLTPAYLVFALDSNPDSYGNMINLVKINTYEGAGPWDEVWHITPSNYTSGMTLEVDANLLCFIRAEVKLNDTLASTWEEARDYTRVYLNISGVFTNKLLGFVGFAAPSGGLWTISYGLTSGNWTLQTDTSYAISLKYEAYY